MIGPGNSAIERHLHAGITCFNRREFFEAHEEMEDAMNLLEDDTADWDFYLGLLRAAVANHKLAQGETSGAIGHLRAALKFLGPYPDRHRGVMLREFRQALNVQLTQLAAAGSGAAPPQPPPRIAFVPQARA
jgi:predicted metal-dependent hydrolase